MEKDRFVYPQLRRSPITPLIDDLLSGSKGKYVELTPEVQLSNFNKFINYRGIKRARIRSLSPNSINSEDMLQQREERLSRMSLLGIGHPQGTIALFEDEDSEQPAEVNQQAGNIHEDTILSDIEDFNMGIDENRIADYLGISRDQDNPDADEFYSHGPNGKAGDEYSSSSGSGQSDEESYDSDDDDNDIHNDRQYEFIIFDKHAERDREYPRRSKRSNSFINREVMLPLNPQTAYINWEFHNKRTQREITCIEDEENEEKEEEEEQVEQVEEKEKGEEEIAEKEKVLPESINSPNTTTTKRKLLSLSPLNSCSELDEKPSLEASMSITFSDDEYVVDYCSEESHDLNEEWHNGGIYSPFRPGFTCINTTSYEKIVELPPAKKFKDYLELEFIGIKKLYDLEVVRKYKNNLVCVITDFVHREDFFVTTSNSQFIIYSFNKITHLPFKNPVLKFDTRPTFTTTTDRVVSTWPYFPHTINNTKTSDSWCGRQILGAATDDASVLIWWTEDIVQCVGKFRGHLSQEQLDSEDNYSERNRFYGFKINPIFKLKMSASAWGIDFLSYKDKSNHEHNLIVASDNSQSITLFYYHQVDERFYHITSHQLLHNIPDVSFLDWNIDESDVHTIRVSCSSISGELVVFEFKFRLRSGPLNKSDFEYFKNEPIYFVDPTMAQIDHPNNNNSNSDRDEDEDAGPVYMQLTRFPRVKFKRPKVTLRTMLGEDVWTCKPINSQYFLPVQSLRAMTGDPWIEETIEVENIVNESTILNLLYDPVKSSNLGGSSAWQFFEAPVVGFSKHEARSNVFESAKLTSTDDEYRRVHKGILKTYKSVVKTQPEPSLNGSYYNLRDVEPQQFIAVTTSKKVGLFRSDSLFCNAATKRLFDLKIPFNDGSKYSNRMSLSVVVPELLCFIVATQQGLVSIMRLCQHRGVFGMRQEHVFPNALNMALGYQGYRTIAGLTVRRLNRNDSSLRPRFGLYITYTDGVVMGYHLYPTGQDVTAANL